MSTFATHAELLEATIDRCEVRRDEKVVLLSSRMTDPADLEPYTEALRRKTDHFIQVRYFPTEITDAHHMNAMLLAAMKEADFVMHYRGSVFPTPFGQLTAHSRGIPEVTATGTRWLDFCLNEANQMRLYPSDETVAETLEAAKLLAAGKELRLTSETGTDLTLRKDGRKGHRQLGISNDKGAWDNFGFAMAACGPLEDSANGVVVLQPGDGMLQMGGIVRDRTELHIENGKIVRIEGGETARAMQQWFAGWGDPESYGVSHIGWGLHPNAVWTGHPRFTVVDGESYRGSILIAFGSNAMDTPAPHSGMGGTRHCVSHLDVPLLNHSFAVDGVDTVRNGVVV